LHVFLDLFVFLSILTDSVLGFVVDVLDNFGGCELGIERLAP